jgi:lysozyme family protein
MRNTDDQNLARLAQSTLHELALYEGVIDGQWGPKSDLAFQVYCNYERYEDVAKLEVKLSADQQADLAKFIKNWKANIARYIGIGTATGIPGELVAAIHWRESGGDFTTYLHNGDPLGRPTTHEPVGILFNNWATAAIDALDRETAAKAQSGIEEWTTTLDCMCIFGEYYNGEGYRARNVPDPYVLAGTSGYEKGKFTADGHFDPEAVDSQLGVLVMLKAILPEAPPPAVASPALT